MPDTDDQSVELDPVQRESGDDDTEGHRERRAAQARAEADRRVVADLTADEDVERHTEEVEQARLDEEDEAAHAERLELAAKDQQELDELRDREQLLDATAETTRAFELAYADEAARDRYRAYATTETQRSIGDLAHGRHELDEAAAHPDELGSAGLAAEGRRYERASGIEARRAVSDDRLADRYDDSAQEHRREARQTQPDAVEAVRNPPKETPEAQLPQARVRSRGPRSRQKKQQEQRRDTGIDLDM
ncbi:hypothetical protein [Kribbella jiaozuonensis]|uniref:Uncharacterized protein n=1 Tax=Kribbella jiaozuonensis TaxID=2575441 RepID=A0A4U3LQ56_9ACTN|nr:hypothetical protein [Kribbella jiaozuonensis]TKK77830.1 hypothetical protein FDA38_22150 [Kribbella jiaozuonensis]